MSNQKRRGGLFTVGFYSPSLPFIPQAWRPREEDREECGPAEADRRFDALVRAMEAGETVDGLVVCSVFEKDARTISVTRSRTSDGFEIDDESTTGDAGLFAALSGDPRVMVGARTSGRSTLAS